VLFWIFLYFFFEILYLRFKYPKQNSRDLLILERFLGERTVKFVLVTFVFFHIFLVNLRWLEVQFKSFIGIFILKDPLAWY
jgi:hypothetical protein